MGDMAHGGRTVLFVSHNMTAIRALCERGLLLDGGILVKNGTTEDAIRAYLQGTSRPQMQLEWDRENAPGNKYVRVHEIELIPETPGEQGVMDVRATLRVRFAFWSLADGQILNLALHLYPLRALVSLPLRRRQCMARGDCGKVFALFRGTF